MNRKLEIELERLLLEYFQEVHLAKDVRKIPRIAKGIEDQEFTGAEVRDLYNAMNRRGLLKQRGNTTSSRYMITEEGKKRLERMKS